MNNTIIILDREYYLLELMLLFDSLGLKYIFRLRDDIYIDERYGMKNDKYLNIKLINKILKMKFYWKKLKTKNTYPDVLQTIN